ncbi:uncharacterized protein JCM6883_000783 [Sporobolomyces salmoneus]|uniref:uncharacterized protein n=1 Tax=Sporobolomyces salmoneus TaxID=183962 RepID=UPI003171316C
MSSSSSSPSTLFQVLLASRTFHDLAKPSLYHHVSITTREQRVQLKEIRWDDKRLIRKLTIEGTKLPAESGAVDNSKLCRLGPGCLEEIFSGQLLDISTIKTIHVANVHEAPDPKGIDPRYNFKTARNLEELSINVHQGGGALWDHVLFDPKYCPKLVRLGMHDVTTYRYVTTGPKRSRGPTKGEREFKMEEDQMYHRNDKLHARLDVIVCNHRLGLGQNGTGVATKHLLLSPPPTPLTAGWLRLAFKSAFNVRFVRVEGDEIPPNSNFAMLLDGARLVSPPRTTFLYLPYHRAELNKEVKGILAQLRKLDAHIFYADNSKEEDSISIIPKQFVEFVEKQKRKENGEYVPDEESEEEEEQ